MTAPAHILLTFLFSLYYTITSTSMVEAVETITIDWVIPPFDEKDTWYANKNANVGDIVNFQWQNYNHNVFKHPSDDCDQTDAIEIARSSSFGFVSYIFQAEDVGQVTFACDYGSHCAYGQVVTIQVRGAGADPDTCVDIAEPFQATKPGEQGWVKQKTCDGWVRRKSTAWRCYNVAGVKENCQKTCTNCCTETEETFVLIGNGKEKTCAWAAMNPAVRCMKPPTRQMCAVTCGECD